MTSTEVDTHREFAEAPIIVEVTPFRETTDMLRAAQEWGCENCAQDAVTCADWLLFDEASLTLTDAQREELIELRDDVVIDVESGGMTKY